MAKDETSAANAAGAPAAKAASPWPALIATIVVMPGIAFGMTKYLIVPSIKSALVEAGAPGAGAASGPAAGAEKGEPHGSSAAGKTAHESGGKGREKQAFTYEFKDIVVNLSGTMGTRYLKTTFTVSSGNADLQKIMTENKNQLLDVTLNVLSAKTLADLEVPNSKNLVRNDLQTSLNHALGSELIDQIYFSEFVVQ